MYYEVINWICYAWLYHAKHYLLWSEHYLSADYSSSQKILMRYKNVKRVTREAQWKSLNLFAKCNLILHVVPSHSFIHLAGTYWDLVSFILNLSKCLPKYAKKINILWIRLLKKSLLSLAIFRPQLWQSSGTHFPCTYAKRI